MKIFLANYEYPGVTQNCGGGGEVTRILATHLRQRGHDVRVFTDDADGHYVTYPLRTKRRLRRELDAVDPDVIHGCFSIPTSLGLARQATHRNVPLVVSVMGADIYDPTRFTLTRPLLDRANRYVFDRADAIVAPSLDMHGRLARNYGLATARVIQYGIDPDEWRRGTMTGDPTILTVARLVERKNIRESIAAVEQLRDGGHEYEYRIVGTGPLREMVADKAAEHDWLTAPGRVDSLTTQYAAADAFLLPSEHEAFGMVYLEAIASGCPVVMGPTGGQVDIIQQRDSMMPPGVISPSTAPGDVADSVAYLFDNYSDFAMGTDGYVAEHFSADRMAREYEQLYHEVCDAITAQP